MSGMRYKADFNKVPLGSLYKFFTSKQDFTDMLELLDKCIDGGIMDLPLTELPALLSAFLEEYQRNAETIAIAIGSMRNYLEGKEEL